VVNGQSGDDNICNMFTEYFQPVYRLNTSGADLQYERQVQNWLAHKSDGSKGVTSIDINVVQRCVDKMKSRKADVHDGIMAQHIKAGGNSCVSTCASSLML